MDDVFEAMRRVYLACAGLSTREKLDLLQLTWLSVASNARTEALVLPGGFPEERARQMALLHEMADQIGADKPDLKAERLLHEIEGLYHDGDEAGAHRREEDLQWHLLDRLRERRDENDGPATESGE
jgi:hypothetical protein